MSTSQNITASGQTIQWHVRNSTNIAISLDGTFSGVACSFKVSMDAVTWYTVQGVRSSDGTVETATGTLSSAPAYGWDITVGGWVYFGLVSTAYTSGTATFNGGAYIGSPQVGSSSSAGDTVVLGAGSAIVGKVTTDQTTHGTTDLVAADITKVAGAAVATGHGTAAGSVRVELPTDGTGVVGLAAGAALIGGAKLIDTAGTTAATVKAASTAPAATDTALVTSESQNSPLLVAPGTVYGTQPGPLCGAVATTAAPSYTSGQINPLSMSTAGNLRTLLATTQVAIPLWGHSAIGSAVPAGGVYLTGIATTSNPTNATAGNVVGVMADKAGRLVFVKENVRENCGRQYTALAANTETTIVTAGAAGVFNDITQIIVTTAGAAAATLTLRDATAGAAQMVFDYPNAALASADPLVINFDPPLKQTTAANNWTITNSVATATNILVRYASNK